MCRQGPVFLHDGNRGIHAAFLQGLKKFLESVKGLVVFRYEFFAGNILDRSLVVDEAARFYTDREAENLSVNRDRLCGIRNPLLIGQINAVLYSQGIDILRVYHGYGIRAAGAVNLGHLSRNCIG